MEEIYEGNFVKTIYNCILETAEKNLHTYLKFYKKKYIEKTTSEELSVKEEKIESCGPSGYVSGINPRFYRDAVHNREFEKRKKEEIMEK